MNSRSLQAGRPVIVMTEPAWKKFTESRPRIYAHKKAPPKRGFHSHKACYPIRPGDA